MAVNTLTLYLSGSPVGIQVYEGSQLHLILVSKGANTVPSEPGEAVRFDPFPQYVDDEELAAALAGIPQGGGGASYTDGQAVDAIQAAPSVSPTGAWNFTQTPTVAGVPVGSGGGGGAVASVNGKTGTVVLSASDVAARPDTYKPPVADLPAGTTLTVVKSGSIWPVRPTTRTDVVVAWKGADPSPTIVTSGNGGMLDGVDYRLVTP